MIQGWGSREDEYNYLFKIVLVGDSGVGKSCLLTRFAWDQFAVDSKSTIGVEFATKSLEIGSQIVKVQVWDTAGQERYRAITTAYYRDAVGAIVVYDITKEESYNSVVRWVKDVRNNTNNRDIAIMLVGNKCDKIKERTVPLESAKAFARNNDLRYENSWLAPAGTHFPTELKQCRKFLRRGDICFLKAKRVYLKTSLTVIEFFHVKVEKL